MGNPHVWDLHLPYFQFEYNTTVNGSTDYSPHELLYEQVARVPTSIHTPNKNLNYSEYANEMRAIFKNIHLKAKENLINSKKKRKLIYDRTAKEWQPMWGDQVLVHRDPIRVGRKLYSTWQGPFEVVERPSEQTAVIMNNGILDKVHVIRLKRFHN